MNIRTITGCVLLCAAAFLASFGWCERSSVAQFLRRATPIEATVVRNVEKSGIGGGKTRIHPVLNIPSQGGKVFQVVHTEGKTSRPRFAVDQKVRLYADPKNALDYRIDAFSDLWLFSSIYLALALITGLAGLYSVLRGGKKSVPTAVPEQKSNI